MTLCKSPSVLELRHFGGLGGGLFADVGGRPFLPVKHWALDCYFGNILGGSAIGSEVLGARFGPVGEVLLLSFFFDGVLELLEDIELFELGVRRHSKFTRFKYRLGHYTKYISRIWLSRQRWGISRGGSRQIRQMNTPLCLSTEMPISYSIAFDVVSFFSFVHLH